MAQIAGKCRIGNIGAGKIRNIWLGYAKCLFWVKNNGVISQVSGLINIRRVFECKLGSMGLTIKLRWPVIRYRKRHEGVSAYGKSKKRQRLDNGKCKHHATCKKYQGDILCSPWGQGRQLTRGKTPAALDTAKKRKYATSPLCDDKISLACKTLVEWVQAYRSNQDTKENIPVKIQEIIGRLKVKVDNPKFPVVQFFFFHKQLNK